MAEWMRPEGRKLMPGDRQFEVAGEVRNFEVSLDNGAVLGVDCAVIRVWSQKVQKFTTIAVTEKGLVIGQSKQATYKGCLDDLREQIES
jgi:hypothetical protein